MGVLTTPLAPSEGHTMSPSSQKTKLGFWHWTVYVKDW